MRYLLKENLEVDFGLVSQAKVAERIGITREKLNYILNRKQTASKPVAFYITHINGGKEKDILKYFDEIKKGK